MWHSCGCKCRLCKKGEYTVLAWYNVKTMLNGILNLRLYTTGMAELPLGNSQHTKKWRQTSTLLDTQNNIQLKHKNSDAKLSFHKQDTNCCARVSHIAEVFTTFILRCGVSLLININIIIIIPFDSTNPPTHSCCSLSTCLSLSRLPARCNWQRPSARLPPTAGRFVASKQH